MAIRLNLLAEALAAEEMRRKDPVKRAIWLGVLLVVLMLVWSSSVMVNAMLRKSEVSRVEAQMKTLTEEFQEVLASQKAHTEIKGKLDSLRRLSSQRLRYGDLLNALQEVHVADVQLMRLQTRHDYRVTAEEKPKTEGKRVIPGKPATVTEQLVITLEGRASSANPEDQALAYRTAINEHPYFQSLLSRTNEARLANLYPPQTDPQGNVFRAFSLECRPPEQTR